MKMFDAFARRLKLMDIYRPATRCSFLYFVILLLILDQHRTDGLDLSKCRVPLGMNSMDIPDTSITASSSYDEGTVGPQFARIKKELKGGAWCPKPAIDKDSYEYLQIDLGRLHVIPLVETQGRFGNGQGQEYTENYLLEYQREDNGNWMRFRNRKGEETIKGNDNTYMAELRDVNPPIIAKRIRFIPYSLHPRTVCMRVEVFGCVWNDGVVSYDMPQGSSRGSEVDLYDFSYDGQIGDTYLRGGMGQLTDGEEGHTNFRLDHMGQGLKGYEWVGWKNNSGGTKPVEITFKFDTVRNFSDVKIHCNNYYGKDVRVFRTALVYFSVGGKYYKKEPLVFDFTRDTVVEYARFVMIRLLHHIGRYVKLVLFYDSRWIMISEISFNSVIALGNITVEKPPPTPSPTTRSPNRPHVIGGHKDVPGGRTRVEIKNRKDKNPYIKGSDVVENSPSVFDIDKNKKGSKGNKDTHNVVPLLTTLPSPHKEKTDSDNLIGIIGGAVGALVLLILIIIFVVCWHQRRSKNNNRRNLKPIGMTNHVNGINMDELHMTSNGKCQNGNVYKSVAMDESGAETPICPGSHQKLLYVDHCGGGDNTHTIQSRKLPDVPPNHSSSTVPDVTQSTLMMTLPGPPRPPRPFKCNTMDKPPNYDSLYAAADLLGHPNIPNLQGASGNNVYSVPNAELLLTMDLTVVEFPRESLRFVEVLGEGQFGEVHLCEAVNINEMMSEDVVINRATGRGFLVAVKMLRQDADDRARADFHKEIKIMSQLKDINIVRVMGVCTREEPLCMIVEYMKYGDLHQFLRDHAMGTTSSQILSYGCTIYISCQIASGMKYLESLNMVHRDLATRNCLVGHNYLIKISDFGMSRSLYSADYYRIEGKAVLPIRWMAWESILLGKFTTKSDVWSFAVTLWEILTYALEQPYDSLSDEQVIENAGHYYRNDGQMCILPEPGNCPPEIFDLMCECWNRQESERPAFKEIHMFLQRKNIGYNPIDEKLQQVEVPVC